MELHLLAEIADACSLSEGPEGVRRVIWTLAHLGPMSVADLSREVLMPLPVVSAMRRELEKRGLAVRGRGVELSDAGRRYAAEALGVVASAAVPSCACGGTPMETPEVLVPTLRPLQRYSAARPEVDTTLDQSYGTPESVLRRALYMWRHDALAGRDVAILGDDDLLSVAACLLARALCQSPPRLAVTVFELDRRIADYINELSVREGLPIECVVHDLRGPLPEEHRARYDVFATDPPYTVAGVRLFVSRGLSALRPGAGGHGFVCFAHKPPTEMLAVQRDVTDMGLQIVEVLPRFNRYEGSAILGGTSQLLHLLTTPAARPLVEGPCRDAIYTGAHGRARRYECAACGRTVHVGRGEQFVTIERLKAQGCPACGGRKLRRLDRAHKESES
ncbi:MAG: bis-aminopropyl spermidine synthase family protein [Armatimonadota bacterium]